MTKQSRKVFTRVTPSVAPRPSTAPQDLGEYALAVGKRVTELVEKALERGPFAIRTDPDSMAEAITDLVLDKIADPDRSELAELIAPVWSAEHARRVLGISRPAMLDRRKTGSLLAVQSSDGDFFYPVSQFEKQAGKVRVNPTYGSS